MTSGHENKTHENKGTNVSYLEYVLHSRLFPLALGFLFLKSENKQI